LVPGSELGERLRSVLRDGSSSDDPKDIATFQLSNAIIDSAVNPTYIVRPSKVDELQELLRLANKSGLNLTVASSTGNHCKGGFAATKENILIDLSPWKQIPWINRRNRVCLIEPGVTYGELPLYEVYVKEKDLGCHLTYRAQVNGWKPGTGISHFGNMGYFAWVVPFARASVEGTVTDGNHTLQVKGVGYHDHNWLDFQFQRIIDYWMWGRIYSQHYTVSFAFIQCNTKMDNHAVKVLMMADGREVVLSTGEFDFIKENFEYSSKAKHSYPKKLVIRVPNELEANLSVRDVLESQDMLDNFSLPLRLIAKYLLRLRPGYFRLASNFEISVTREGRTNKETGTALHEIVLFRSAE